MGNIDNLGHIIKEARIAQGIKRETLAERVGVSYRYLQNVENTNKRPSYKVIVKLVRELGVSLDASIYPERAVALERKEQIIDKIKKCDEDSLDIIEALLNALLSSQNKRKR